MWGLGPALGPRKLLGISLLNMHSLHFGVPFYTIFDTGIQILDQMDMYLFLKNYFLLKYQSIMHKNHNAMFMINVHFIMYNLYEPMKIK